MNKNTSQLLSVLLTVSRHEVAPQLTKYSTLKKQLIQDPLIFTLPEDCTVFFVTESIPRIVEEAGLRGFRFDLLDG